jgi:integrase
MVPSPLPLFDALAYVSKNAEYVHLPCPKQQTDFTHVLRFLKSYGGSEGTFNSYRREAERLLHFSWLILNKTLSELRREDIEAFLYFCQQPPKHWIAKHKTPRYIEKNGERIPNSDWRPFVQQIDKVSRKNGIKPVIQHKLSQGSIAEMLAILSTLFNFLIAEEYVYLNPVALIRQKSKFVQRSQQQAPIRRLSMLQWETLMMVVDKLAVKNPLKHERTYFILSLLFGMYLRISELVQNHRHTPTMGDFYKDMHGNWWFQTVGKGNKKRQIAVSDTMLMALKRYRCYLGLTPLPYPGDTHFLLPKIKGSGALTDTAPIRRLIQTCFDLTVETLRIKNETEEANQLQHATVHWLRHTGISEDVKIRPREHVRDDAGHSSSATTDRYIDIEHRERHASAKHKKLYDSSHET